MGSSVLGAHCAMPLFSQYAKRRTLGDYATFDEHIGSVEILGAGIGKIMLLQ